MPLPVTTAYPPAPPTISGTAITVDMFLSNPAQVQRAIQDLTLERFVTDVVFGSGPAATGGAVVYDQVTETDLYLDRDVQEIEPGGEFPLLNGPGSEALVALAKKWGGEVFLTDEQIRRNNRPVLNRAMTQLRNTIIRKVDALGMAALRAAPTLTHTAAGDWSTAATDIIGDLATVMGLVNALDMGYVLDTVLLNPLQEVDLLKDKDIRDALPRERDDSLIRTGNMGRLMGLDFIVTNQVQAGEIFALQRGIVGGISDEVPLYTKPIPDERRERVYLHGARVPAVYVTDPKAVVRITGA